MQIDTTSPAAVVRTYFHLIDDDTVQRRTLGDLLHSESTVQVDRAGAMEALDMTDIAVERLHISTEHENLTASALERTVGPMLDEDRLHSVLDAIADENATLAVDVELTGDAFEPERFLVAPEDGEWRIVAFE